jgi:PAS domain S-box-containing protein
MMSDITRQPSDRRQLQQIIAGLTEGVILVDPDHRIAWANEAALAMHGADTLAELGATVTEYRKRFMLRYRNAHPLKAGQYPIERVLAGEAFSDVVVEVARAGETEPEWVHRVRSLVLTDASGAPDCLVLILHDATERFEAEERFEASFNVNPAPAIICRLSDRLYIKVNPGFLEMTGFHREDVIGRSFSDIDVLAGCDFKEMALSHLTEGQAIPQMEARLHLPDGRSKFVIVAGHPIEVRDENCMLFTFIDLDPRKRAEDALLATERRARADYEAIYTETPVALHSLDDDGHLISASNFWLELLEYSRDEVIGRDITDFMEAESARVHRETLWPQILAAGSLRNAECQFVKKSGAIVHALVSARIQRDRAEGEVRTMAAVTDITERKQSEERFAKAFRLAPVPMIVCLLGCFRIVDANQAFLAAIGRPLEDVVGHGADELKLWESPAGIGQFERTLIAAGSVRDLDVKVQTASGNLIDCLMSAETVSIDMQRCALVVMQDITERRRSEAQLFEAIEAVMQDTSWFSRTVIEKLAMLRQPEHSTRAISGLADLTGREREILGLMSQGLSDADITKQLGISRSTVRNYVTAIFGKIDVHSRSGAIVWARARGFTGGRPSSAEKASASARRRAPG